MRAWQKALLGMIAVGILGVVSVRGSVGAPAVTSDLSGHWVLSEKLSDRMPSGGPSGPSGPGGPGGPSGSSEGPPEGMRGPRMMLRDMIVEQSAERILLSQRGKVERALLLKSGEVPRMSAEGVAQSKAAWDNGKLVIDEMGPRGRVLETWELAKRSTQLVVLIRIQRGQDDPIDRKRVYERAKSK